MAKYVLRDLEMIHPKVSEVAAKIDTVAAYQKAGEVLANVSYSQAYAILQEAEELLKALIKRNKDTRMAKEDRSNLRVIADRGIIIGELASTLKTINTHIIGA